MDAHPMDVNLIVVAVSGFFFAGIIKGATGIGYSSCALPFLVASLGLKEANRSRCRACNGEQCGGPVHNGFLEAQLT
jgi:hypothetical protein